MYYNFKGKKFTTIVHTRSVTNIATGERVNYAHTYGVYDNEKESEIVIVGFKPRSYEEVQAKAIELNDKL